MTTAVTKTLIAELSWIDRFVEKKTTIPVIAAVLMKASGEFLKLAATDLETSGVTFCDVQGDSSWETLVPVKALLKYLAKVEEKEVSLHGGEGALTVEHGDNKVKIVATGKVEHFPQMPAELEVVGTIQDLENVIPQIETSISPEESRFTLNGALLEVRKGEAVMVSTDGHRLSHVELRDCAFTDDFRMLVPKKALSELGRIVKGSSVRVSNGEQHIAFSVGNRKIISKKLTGNFPDYERIMPKAYPTTFEVEQKPLTKLLERVRTMADERTTAARWELSKGTLTIIAEKSEGCRAQGSVKLESGESNWGIGLKCDYVLDFLKIADEVKVSVRNSRDAAQFQSGNWTYVVMPMRM